MLIPLSEIYPSPWNPKKDLTKEEKEQLRNSIDRFGWSAFLILCRRFDFGGDGYYALDGNTRLELLKEMGFVEVDCIVNEKITNLKLLKEFVAVFDNIKKKFKGIALYEAISRKEIDVLSMIKINIQKYEPKETHISISKFIEDETETLSYYIRIKKETINFLKSKKNKMIADLSNNIKSYYENMTDADFLSILIENMPKKNKK